MRRLTPVLTLDMDFAQWAASYDEDRAPEPYPYGLGDLPDGWTLDVPEVRHCDRVTALARRVVLKATGADLVGALQRQAAIRRADVVYSHSEADYLGVAFVLLLARARTPILVGQTIWLFAQWDRLPWWKRRFLTWLMRRVDLFVYNATPNLDLGRRIAPRGRHEYVPFGAAPRFVHEAAAAGRVPAAPGASYILTVGNDVSRDWDVLAAVTAALPANVSFRVATHQKPAGLETADVRPTVFIRELCDLYRQARCVVVGLHPNAHAGGITTILEAATFGVPIVATDTGGLGDYFTPDEVRFVPPEDPQALVAAVTGLLHDPVAAEALGARARAATVAHGLTISAYWERVLALVGPARS